MRYPEASAEELQAPKGQYRVIGVDLKVSATANYHLGDFATLSMAEQVAREKGCVGTPVYVFDDKSDLVVRYGSWH